MKFVRGEQIKQHNNNLSGLVQCGGAQQRDISSVCASCSDHFCMTDHKSSLGMDSLNQWLIGCKKSNDTSGYLKSSAAVADHKEKKGTEVISIRKKTYS